MKVYIDVSNLMTVDFLTGIQRVVREVVVRLFKQEKLEIVLLSCGPGKNNYDILINEKFVQYFVLGKGEKGELYSGSTCTLEELEAGSVFFDIDSVWMSRQRRSAILPILKNNGVKIAVFIHDIIPVTYPQYCNENTAFFFLSYLGAFLQYADIIVTSTESTLKEIEKLMERLQLPSVPGYVTGLGSDFSVSKSKAMKVSSSAQNVVKQGKYILCVGTIEPRKNHTLLLDAFDQKLEALGINLVMAGRIGWNVEDLQKRIESHPQFGKKIFHLSGENDASIDYLYRNAYMVAFPTFEEGFGLPMVEAFERQCVLAASDIPVLKEVGGEFCDYFNPHRPDELVALVEKYLADNRLYEQKKNKVLEYKPVTWDIVSDKIAKALLRLKSPEHTVQKKLKQIVYLSARVDMLLETLPYVERFMGFITEAVICCPDKVVHELKARYQGRLKLTILTDSEVLNGKPLPKDHVTRHFYLRCLATQNEKIDDVFIMSDDDYRPLKEIGLEHYYREDKYIAYYCFNLERWSGAVWAPTSFDSGTHRTAEFLKDNGYPCKHYESHMPQIIDKKIFLEMLQRHQGIEEKGYCEWNTYFNFVQYFYPDIIQTIPYKTMGWPGNPTDWKREVFPEEYLYENFYEESYEKGAIFEGLSRQYHDDIDRENKEKIAKFSEREKRYQKYQEEFDFYSQIYMFEYREKPQIGVVIRKEWEELVVPRFLVIKRRGFVRIPFEICVGNSWGKWGKLKISSYYSDQAGNIFGVGEDMNLPVDNCKFEFPLYGYHIEGNYYYNIKVSVQDRTLHKIVPIRVLS